MSGFDTSWLDLREPADHAARDSQMLEDAAASLTGHEAPLVLDLGCGTGSTFRALSPKLRDGVHWRLLDNDPRLLAEATRRLAQHRTAETVEADLTDLAALDLRGVDLVTASALFDLVSATWLERFVACLSGAGTALYAALSYDGRIEWREPHPLDEAIVAAFNRHQRGDKGLGPALGPAAGPSLADTMAGAGYRVRRARSDWLLGEAEQALEGAFLAGVAGAVRETGRIGGDALDAWEEMRRSAVGTGCRVGHLDVLALPPAG